MIITNYIQYLKTRMSSWGFLFWPLAARAVVFYLEIFKHALSQQYMLMELWVGPKDDPLWLEDCLICNNNFKSLITMRVRNYDNYL